MKEIRKIIIEREPGYICSDIKEFEKITITPYHIFILIPILVLKCENLLKKI